MFCPKCGQEYRDGVTVCGECDVALTPDPPDPPPGDETEWRDLETVLVTSDPALLAVARSLLDAEGIPTFSRGELLQDVVGWGRLPGGSNLVSGPVRLEVPADRSQEARALLAAVDTPAVEPPAEESGEE